jgi:predicted transcriptional regulator
MKDLIQIQQKLVPDLLDEMKSRYRILQQIQLTQPIGRRTLAQNLGTTERILRAEVEFLKNQALISAETVGMSVTEAGRQILNQLELVMRELEGFRELEEKLSRALGIPKVYIVPGDSEKNSLVKREMGYLTARIIKENLREGVLAITGNPHPLFRLKYCQPEGAWAAMWKTRRIPSQLLWQTNWEAATGCCMCQTTFQKTPTICCMKSHMCVNT